ncbi:MAG: SusE domain-containing protein, partial [Candidatus Methylacidiphilales bacterium]
TEASTALVNINWNKSANATSYRWFATTATGSFSAPLLRVASNNAGTDSVLTLTSGGIDNILNSLNIKRTDSVKVKWTVYAYMGSDSLKANQDWNITLVLKRILGAFNLTAPSNNARVEVVQNSAATVTISWSGANAANKYVWKATTLNGNFTNPLLNLNSDNSGTNNNLTLTSGAIDGILATNGVKRGDSITLQWTVFAFETTDSLKATETFNITLIRKRILGSFNLSNPINNARLVVTPNSTSPIIINWIAAANAVTYKWKAATLTGNFTNPLLNLASDNAGVDAKLTLTHNALDAVLASNGIAKGDSIKLQWTVFAYETTDSLKANETFNITLVRGAGVGVNNIDFKNNFNVYPNPAQTELNINSNELTGNLKIKLYSITGKLLIDKNMEASANNKIDVSHLQDGIYMLSIEGNNGKTATIKVVVAH